MMIFRSPHPNIQIPAVSLTDFALATKNIPADKPALIDGPTGRTFKYGDLVPSIRNVSAGFARYGVKKGDVVAVVAPNSPEYVIAFHAAIRLGAIVTMVPPIFTDTEMRQQLQNSGANHLITIPQLLSQLRNLNLNVANYFVIGDSEDAVSVSSLLLTDADQPEMSLHPEHDLAALPYSSGTTGLPKGVMLTHYNLVAMLAQMEAVNPFSADDVLVCVVPMYHLYGLHIVANLALRTGATVVTLPRYEETDFLKTLEAHEVTVAPLVPPIVQALSQSPNVDEFDLSALRVIHCGAASLAPEIAQSCSDRLKCEIRFGYGLTEVSPLSHVSAPELGSSPSSVGFCLPNTECRIVDVETQCDVGPGHTGEIWLRGPQMMSGYIDNKEATNEILVDGWIRSGDIGYVGEDGELYVIDRLKELIKYKGRQVAPAELEALLLTHPAIADAAVVPLPDADAGEVPKAFVVVMSGFDQDGTATSEKIIEFVAANVAPYKRIRQVQFVSEIPRSPAGKILRRLLKDEN